MMNALTILAAVLLVSCVGVPRAEAQSPAASFEDIAVFVRPGDRIQVIDAGGVRIEGRLAKLSPDVLTVLTGAGPRQLGRAEVAVIRQRRDDSLWNGAIIGAAAGAGYFATLMAILHETSDGGDVIVPTAIAGATMIVGMGAAAGAGIDALIRRHHVIYRKPGAKGSVTVSPMLGGGRRGALVSLRF